ncbi:MAG TPA: signal peptidase II [Candidatus Obscuribacterales bacterium]
MSDSTVKTGSASMIKSCIAPLVALLICLAIDRLSKAWALANLPLSHPVPYIPGLLNFTLTTNTGAAFSMGHQNGLLMTILATTLTTLLFAWISSRIARRELIPLPELLGIGCLLGGSLGNLIDRYMLGRVTDFLDIALFPFPVFNFADVFIDVGLALILIARMRSPSHACAQAEVVSAKDKSEKRQNLAESSE